jgi:RND family efflux transporter MFP subunit
MMKQVVGCLFICVSSISFAATSVVVKPLSELLTVSSQSAPAQVINDDHAVISARLSANVDKVLVKTGDIVEKGQTLIQLECSDYHLATQQSQGALKALQAQIRLARQQLSRAERLLKQKNASLELRDQRRAELASLLAQEQGSKAGLATSELAVERCTPKAPFSGVITTRMVSQGSLVTPGTPLVQVLGHESSEVAAHLTEAQLENLKTLDLTSQDSVHYQFAGQRYPIELRSVVPLIDTRARTQEARFSFIGDSSALTGSSGRVVWQEPVGRLPIQYVVSRNGELGLMQIVEGKADFIKLPNAIEGQAPKVNLPSDILIIVEGQHGIKVGQAVVATEVVE